MFCKYCGHPLNKGAVCNHCGKENVVTRRSDDLDRLMSNPVQSTEKPAAKPLTNKTYQQGLTEGFANGHKEGYETGVKEGFQSGNGATVQELPRAKKHRSFVYVGIVSMLVLGIAIGGVAFHAIGYRDGQIIGQENGRQEAINAMTAQQAAEMETIRQEYENRLAEAYQSGYEQGKDDTITALEMPVPTPTPAPLADWSSFVLARGSKGNAVREVQTLLRKWEYNVSVDGDYGANTEAAVLAFQVARGLSATGRVDILTYWALLQEAADDDAAAQGEDPVSYGTQPTSTPRPEAPLTPFPEAALDEQDAWSLATGTDVVPMLLQSPDTMDNITTVQDYTAVDEQMLSVQTW